MLDARPELAMHANVRTNLRAIAGALAFAVALACNTDRLPTSPRVHPSGALAAADSQPFYYASDGTPIYLTPDPTEIVFTSSTPAHNSQRRQRADHLSVAGERQQRIDLVPGWYKLYDV